jgi:hypothetical protein
MIPRRMIPMKKLVISLLIVALTSSASWADSSPDQRHIKSIRKKVDACVDQHRRVVIETYDNRRLQGFITEAKTDDFVISYAGRATALSYADVRKVKWPSPVLKQVELVGAAMATAGVLFGLLILAGGLKG